MKPGLEIGQQTSVTAEVTPEMYAQFEGTVVHPVYSTVSMVYHMEWVSRKIVLPYLEAHEEGMGGAVNATHLLPTPAGETITATATITELKDHSVLTEVMVANSNRVVGKGEVRQFILPKDDITRKIEKQTVKWQ